MAVRSSTNSGSGPEKTRLCLGVLHRQPIAKAAPLSSQDDGRQYCTKDATTLPTLRMTRNTRARTTGNRIVTVVYNGPSRRPRLRTAPTAREIRDQARFDQNIRDGQRLGIIPEIPPPLTTPTNQENNDPVNQTANQTDGADDAIPFQPFEDNHQESQWEDDDPLIAHASYHRMRRYAERRERINAQWTQLETQVTSAYLQCQHQTLNWTNPLRSFELPAGLCTCSPADIQERKVDLIDILSVVSASAFVKALAAFLGPRNNQAMFARGGKYRRRNLRIPFTFSTDLFARILIRKKKILNDGLQLSKVDLWANKCPRCFGPSLNEVKSNPNEPDVILAMDGNFQQRHYTHASRDNPGEDQYPIDFLAPSQLNTDVQAVASTEGAAVGIDPPCSDSHKAANDTRSGTSWEKCDDNGLFASACRHDAPLLFANIFQTGEKLYYPVSIVRNIIADFPNHKFGILYDLGCHLESHVRKRGLLTDRINDLTFGTSVFHAFVHEWSCQVKYNPRLNDWWGLSDGEGLERLWSFLSPLVSPLRVSTRLHRLTKLQARAEYYTEQLLELSVYATDAVRASTFALQTLHAKVNRFTPGQNYTNQFFAEQWQLEQQYHRRTNLSVKKQKVELGRLLCLEEALDTAWRNVTLTPEQALARATTCATLTRKIAEQRTLIGEALMTAVSEIEQGGVETEQERDLLMMILYNKTELRQKFLALLEEKQPLVRVRRAGETSSLGTRAQQKLMALLHKHAEQLRTVLESYTQQVLKYIADYPTRPAPRIIQYADLLELPSDDPFWNDGFFSDSNEAWAIDLTTQQGIRHLACMNRGNEEIRRLGWETRRAMRWAINRHNKLKTNIKLLFELSVDQQTTVDNLPELLRPLVGHPYLLANTSLSDRLQCIRSILHSAYIEIMDLQLGWDPLIVEVLRNTPPQNDDGNLQNDWQVQISHIHWLHRMGFFSGIPGDMYDGVLAGVERVPLEPPNPGNNEEDVEDEGNEEEDEEDGQQAYLEQMENVLSTTMLNDLIEGQEQGRD
ncbi:uncharacterized protein PGTG_11358 [Puccinia graminis f. sp. tritici CRL 75-36-700-3]|uniref:CxC1-like cysteine cluster associated with KDZ transposases domain-containing protein n=1 Tax=Puccinia graminis f. sp. tritici (strain CRL 75-36-700-3 / race SCCL) TaxID=418459 RepID=E3KLL4_PUCGT|nr:uncharacterized protein PGTG_11358 [Puccinia graminis f. sp. tritici CRL 75-36-700-3]EFP85189.2 hypothetical protein PGTG_11358 [Puccinia graminis f. sp. tritici CRL 75-36-700-3]